MKALNATLTRRDLFVLDALRISLRNERLAYTRLKRSLDLIARLPEGKPPSDDRTCAALATAWQIVDDLYRIRGLIRQVRGLPQRNPEVQTFLRGTVRVEQFRHFFQHLNSAIGQLPAKAFPIMGVLSWVTHDPHQSRSVSFGHLTKDTQLQSLVVDTYTMSFVEPLQLDAAASSLPLAKVHARAKDFSRFLEHWLKSQAMLGKGSVATSVFRFGIAAPGA